MYLWARQLPDLNFNNQWYWLAMAGAGCGLVLSPAATDMMNRVPDSVYGEVTGIQQTLRNFGSSLGLAILGSILITQTRLNIEGSLTGFGLPKDTGRLDRRLAEPVVGIELRLARSSAPRARRSSPRSRPTTAMRRHRWPT